MTVEELDAMIEGVDKEITKAGKEAGKILKMRPGLADRKVSAKQKAEAKPFKELALQLRGYKDMLAAVRDSKIPPHEKIPTDCEFYKHFMNATFSDKVGRAADEKAELDRALL